MAGSQILNQLAWLPSATPENDALCVDTGRSPGSRAKRQLHPGTFPRIAQWFLAGFSRLPLRGQRRLEGVTPAPTSRFTLRTLKRRQDTCDPASVSL
jgi:hypothetical protein